MSQPNRPETDAAILKRINRLSAPLAKKPHLKQAAIRAHSVKRNGKR